MPVVTPLDENFLPVSGFVVPRFAGPSTFMRLPLLNRDEAVARKVDIGLIGVPWDNGTSNRSGARHGPRALRDASTMVRMFNQATGVHPFHVARCADLGDAPVNPVDLMDALAQLTAYFADIAARGIVPLSFGGDHLTSLPILRALGRHAPLGMIHFDAHTDFYDTYFGDFRYAHGTPFRRAVEEGLLDPRRIVQIGLRGTSVTGEDVEFARSRGVRMFFIEEVMELGPEAVMQQARAVVGDAPTYVSFDIDVIDPSQAPGTGTPEIGGISTFMAQQMLRALAGLNLVGADLVEVSPPFDVNGLTAWTGASLGFEILCPLALAVARARTTSVG